MKIAPFLLVALAAAHSLFAADFPELVLPEGVGVNIHFTRGHEQDLEMIAAAGFKIVRMDFSWSGIERRRGEYDWTAYEELTTNLERHGLRALYILDYSNELYEEVVVSKNPINGQEQRSTASPQHPESVAAFARWAGAAAKHFAGRRIIWEIWNEPNIHFWKPEPNAQQYIDLARAAGAAVRQADPDATVIGPATSQVPEPFLREIFTAGLLDVFDGVSVHPYRSYDLGPETAIEDYGRLRGLIKEFGSSEARQTMPIISGEWGYSTYSPRGLSLDTQAAFIVRQQLANLSAGVPISIWYDWKDDGTDPAEREHNFGTVTHDLKLKPAYIALRTMTKELAGFRIARRLATPGESDWVLLLGRGDEQKLAAWTVGDPHPIKVDNLEISRATSRASDGTTTPVEIHNNTLSLTLGAMPQYVTITPAR